MTDLASLIAKLEAATEGSRELDCEITAWRLEPITKWNGVKITSWFSDENGLSYGCNTEDGYRHLRCVSVAPFTTSLDAALSLVPEGKDWDVMWLPTDTSMRQPTPRAEACVYPVPFMVCPDEDRCYSEAASPALALTIAALKAGTP